MFIKKAYEDRLKKESNQENQLINSKAHHQIHTIGHIQTGKINFDKDEQFFSPDDIPSNARQAQKQVLDQIDPDLLGLKKPKWNNSTSVPQNPLQQETHERRLIQIKLGLFDHPVPVLKDKKLELGTDTRNDYTGWQVSTQFQRRDILKNVDKITEHATTSNKLQERMYIKEYKTPLEKTNDLNENLRKKQMEEKDVRDQIRENLLFENHTSTKEQIDAIVFRKTYESQIRENQITNDPSVTFKPDMSKTLRNDTFVKSYHTGIWQNFKFDKDEEGNLVEIGAWSCCMNEEQQSLGCNQYLVDKNRWNFVSFVQH